MADVAESADQLAHEVTTSPEATAREQVPPKEAGNVAPPVLDPVEQPKNSKDASGCPHVFVTGDLAELQLVHWHDKLPDHSDANMAPYRRLRFHATGHCGRGMARCKLGIAPKQDT